MSAIYTPEEVANYFKTNRRLVLELARAGKWPHLRLNRNQIRFTEEHLRTIESNSELSSSERVVTQFDRKLRRTS